MIGKLNHVGVATPSIEESWRLYRDFLGAVSVTPKRALPEQGVWVSFVELPNAQIELIEPLDEASPIHRFLERNPRGGQHHVCFEVADILAARDEVQAKGAAVLGDGRPRIGAHGTPVIFVHPKDMGGVLVELMEAPPLPASGGMSLTTAIVAYLMIWWVALFAILPLGVRSHAEAGLDVPGGGDPASPVDPKLKRKFFTTTWVAAVLFAALWLVLRFHWIRLAVR